MQNGEVVLQENLTVLVLTLNEEENIHRTLSSIQWAGTILVVDSGSTDRTLDIVRQFPQARVLSRKFDTHARQWNFGLGQVQTEWVLTLDADYLVPPSMEQYVAGLDQSSSDGHFGGFLYAVYGKVIRGSVLPPRLVLFRTRLGMYIDDGHTQRLKFEGTEQTMPFNIIHDDRKPLARWVSSQIRYAELECVKLTSTQLNAMPLQDKLRRLIVVAPFLVFFLVYLFRGGFLSGWRGMFYALQRFFAEVLIALFLVDRKLKGMGAE